MIEFLFKVSYGGLPLRFEFEYGYDAEEAAQAVAKRYPFSVTVKEVKDNWDKVVKDCLRAA